MLPIPVKLVLVRSISSNSVISGKHSSGFPGPRRYESRGKFDSAEREYAAGSAAAGPAEQCALLLEQVGGQKKLANWQI